LKTAESFRFSAATRDPLLGKLSIIIFIVVPCIRILSKSFLFSPTDALYIYYIKIKIYIKIHIKIAPTCFGLTTILREHITVKNWVAQFKRGDFPTCDAPRPGRLKKVTTPEFIDQIQELILVDRRFSAKSRAELLGISRERVGSISHEDLGIR
jgi:hypothetical protein